MPTPLERLRAATRAGAMGGLTVSMMYGALLHLRTLRPPQRHETKQRWMRKWAGWLLSLFGVKRTLVSPPPQPATGARLVIANHRSPLDIILMLSYFGGSVLSRDDLKGWPVLGEAARRWDTIFVDRDDPKSGVRAIREIRRRLRDGRTVVVFPEGTTHKGDEVRDFIGGAFAAVKGLDVELLPVGIAYQPGVEFVDETFMAHINRVAARPSTPVAVCIGEPVRAVGQREELSRHLRDRVQALVWRARAGL